MLTIGRSVHHLSIDIDVIYPPGANIEIRLSEKSIDFGSIELELVKRKQRNDANILKSHSKFFYKIAYRNDTNPSLLFYCLIISLKTIFLRKWKADFSNDRFGIKRPV